MPRTSARRTATRNGGRGRSTAVTQRSPNAAGQKLSVAQRDLVLDFLGRGWTPSKVRDALVEAGVPRLTLQTILDYRKRHPEEILQKRDAWMATLRREPLANVRDRLRELLHMYGTGVLTQFRELCPKCGGDGTLPILRRPVDERGRTVPKADPVKGTIRCEVCRGRKWVLPERVQHVLATTGDDIRLDTLPERPPAIDPEGVEFLRDLLRQIRDEVGDGWSPREQSTKPEGSLVGGNVNMVVIGGSKEEYIAKLRAMRGAPPLPPPTLEVSPTPSGGNGGPPTELTP